MTMREKMEDQIRRDMLGPGSERFNGFSEEEETITVYEPWNRYSVGLLYPHTRRDEVVSEDGEMPQVASSTFLDASDNGTLSKQPRNKFKRSNIRFIRYFLLIVCIFGEIKSRHAKSFFVGSLVI